MTVFGSVEGYYRLHAKIYDVTRWSFLFGREAIIQKSLAVANPASILEVGCGTGKNLLALQRQVPNAEILGLDLSAHMLRQARKRLGSHRARVTLRQQAYDRPLNPAEGFDLVLFSYCLSMINPGWQQAIESAAQDLRPGGLIAVVDFHASKFVFFKRWMAMNHVAMEGHLLPKLNASFRPLTSEKHSAYGGLWQYLLFVGEKR